MDKIKWGIIGLGKIANKFAADLLISNVAVLQGVASRDLTKAKIFAEKYKAKNYCNSYAELAQDSEIDVVYIATPHTFHFENAMMCLRKGKSVLCEKPMGINLQEVELLVQEAKERKLFLMEGLWTRFIPATEKFIELLGKNEIGEIQSVVADFGFKGDVNPDARLFNKELGGGSLLDIGIYPIYLSILSLGLPIQIKATARMTNTGVDSFCSMSFQYENGSTAQLESSFEEDTAIEGLIQGSAGSIKLHNRFHHTEQLTITQGGVKKVLDINYKGNGYFHEIEEVNNCLFNQQTESFKLPLQLSLDLMSVIERVKKEIGLQYESRVLK